jgi:hypothetical protein
VSGYSGLARGIGCPDFGVGVKAVGATSKKAAVAAMQYAAVGRDTAEKSTRLVRISAAAAIAAGAAARL